MYFRPIDSYCAYRWRFPRFSRFPIPLPWLALALLLACSAAQADIVIQGTRAIFKAEEQETTVQLRNEGRTAVLVQAWLDNGEEDASPGQIEVPFVMSPTLFRLEPGKGQALRILYAGEPLPADRETLFWLNVLEVPPKLQNRSDNASSLRFVVRTRIKLMHRPAGLPGNAQQAPAQLQWALQAGSPDKAVLKAVNPTAYVVNLNHVELKAGGRTFSAGLEHVLPGESALFPVKDTAGHALANATVVYSSLNDWGGVEAHEAALAP